MVCVEAGALGTRRARLVALYMAAALLPTDLVHPARAS